MLCDARVQCTTCLVHCVTSECFWNSVYLCCFFSVAGHFGCVYAATLRDNALRNPIPVAVKTIEGKLDVCVKLLLHPRVGCKVLSSVLCLWVCLCVRSHISKKTHDQT